MAGLFPQYLYVFVSFNYVVKMQTLQNRNKISLDFNQQRDEHDHYYIALNLKRINVKNTQIYIRQTKREGNMEQRINHFCLILQLNQSHFKICPYLLGKKENAVSLKNRIKNEYGIDVSFTTSKVTYNIFVVVAVVRHTPTHK